MILIQTALFCEAKALIDYYQLQKVSDKPFKIYSNDFMKLIITGVGKTLSAAGCSHLITEEKNASAIINLGVAGHKSFPIGKTLLANQVIDQDENRCYYPTFVFSLPAEGSALKTVSAVQTSYENELLYDMEASSFCKTASLFLPFELIHVLKIVSDNEEEKVTDKSLIQNLIQQAIPTLNHLIEELLKISDLLKQRSDETDPDEYTSKYHFTVTQKHKLKDILSRMKAFNLSPQKQFSSAQEFLQSMETLLKKGSFHD